MDAAIDAMTREMGFDERLVRATVKELLKVAFIFVLFSLFSESFGLWVLFDVSKGFAFRFMECEDLQTKDGPLSKSFLINS